MLNIDLLSNDRPDSSMGNFLSFQIVTVVFCLTN